MQTKRLHSRPKSDVDHRGTTLPQLDPSDQGPCDRAEPSSLPTGRGFRKHFRDDKLHESFRLRAFFTLLLGDFHISCPLVGLLRNPQTV